MEIPLAYLLTGFCVLGGGRILWHLAGRRAVLSPPVVFAGIYTIYHVPLAISVAHESLGFLLLVNLALACFIAGAVLASDGRAIASETRRALEQRLALSLSVRTWAITLALLITLAIGFAIAYYQGLPPYLDVIEPVLEGDVKGAMAYLSQERQTLTKSHYFGGSYRGQGMLAVVTQESWKYLMVFTALLASCTSRRSYKVMTLTVFVLSYAFVAGTSERGPFAWAVIAVLIAFSYTRRISMGGWIQWAAAIGGILFLLTLMAPKYSLEGNIALNITDAIVSRILFGNGMSTFHIYDLVQNGTLTFQYGLEHLRVFLNALPGATNSVPLAHELLFLTNPHARPWMTTYLSHTYLGLIYLDFGVFGASIAFFVLGWALQKLHFFVLGSQRFVLNMTFLAITVQHAGHTANKGIINFFPPMLILLAFHLIAILMSRVLGQERGAVRPWNALGLHRQRLRQ